jgi:hypothetical protein
MKKSNLFLVLIFITLVLIPVCTFSQSIQQKLTVVQNSGVNGGTFKINLQVMGINLPVANTLGSATIDISYDSTIVRYINADTWAFGATLGYARYADNIFQSGVFRKIRITVLGSAVNGNGGGDPPGYDIGSNYAVWLNLNFIILNAAQHVSLTILNSSNQIGLFENHSNDPNTAVINPQTLLAPINIINFALPVINKNKKLPSSFQLSQNYPNPFNSTTIIEYGIPLKGLVLIKLFNVLGQYLKTLVNEEQSSGYYKVYFDANKYSSGIYFYSIEYSGKKQIKSMILIK